MLAPRDRPKRKGRNAAIHQGDPGKGTRLYIHLAHTKLLVGWRRWIAEDFIGADDLAVEGAGN
jgi:hypothetical protein